MKRVATILVAIVSIAGIWAPAQAKSPSNCAFLLVPVSQVEETTTASLELIGCYGTYEEAIEAGFAGTIDIATGTTPQSLTQAELAPAATASSNVLIGTEWTAQGYVGSSYSYYASVTCSASTTWQVNYVGDAWNDRFASGKGFGGCDTNKKFEHADYAGAVVTCTPNCSYYGTIAGSVSSLRWKP